MAQFFSIAVDTQPQNRGTITATGQFDLSFGVRFGQSPFVLSNFGNMELVPIGGGLARFTVTIHSPNTNHRFTLRKLNGPDDCTMEQNGLQATAVFTDDENAGT